MPKYVVVGVGFLTTTTYTCTEYNLDVIIAELLSEYREQDIKIYEVSKEFSVSNFK